MRYKDEAWNPNHETDAHGLQIKFFFCKNAFKKLASQIKSHHELTTSNSTLIVFVLS